MKTIQPGQTLTARSMCNYDCIFTATVISRSPSGKSVTVKTDTGRVARCKIHTDSTAEFIFAHGQFSMAPVFRAK